jgi:hypothetical protein
MSEREKIDLEAGLIEELAKHIERLKRHAQSFSRGAYLCYVVAFVASAATSLLTVANWGPRPVLALLTAIPALALLCNSVFVFEAKTRWYWGKVAHYDGLLHRLKFERCVADEASKDKREFDSVMQEQYPKFSFNLLPVTPAETNQSKLREQK